MQSIMGRHTLPILSALLYSELDTALLLLLQWHNCLHQANFTTQY